MSDEKNNSAAPSSAAARTGKLAIIGAILAAGSEAPGGTLRAVAWANLVACLLVLMATSRMTITLH